MPFDGTSVPPRSVAQFCAAHNLTLTPQLARMSLAEISHMYASQCYEPIGTLADNRALPVIFVEEDNGSQEPAPVTYQPDPIAWQSLGAGCWVGKSTRKNLEWHRQAVFIDRYASILREDAQWAKN